MGTTDPASILFRVDARGRRRSAESRILFNINLKL
jgi:hypothetical protein